MFFKKIGTQLVALVILAVVAFGSMIIAYVVGSTRDLTEELGTQAMRQASTLERKALDSYLKNLVLQAKALSNQEAIKNVIAGESFMDATLQLHAYAKSSEDLWAAFVFNAEGVIVAGANAKGEDMASGDRSKRDRKDRAYVQAILAGKDQYITQDVIKAASGDALIFGVSVPIRDDAGKTIGGVALLPYWDSFAKEFIESVTFGQTGYAFIIDGKGRLIAHPNRDLRLKDISDQVFVKKVMAQQSGIIDYTWEGRRKALAFETSPVTGWVIAASMDYDEICGTALHQRNVLTVMGLAVVLVLAGIILMITRHLVSTPLSSLMAFSAGIARGNLKSDLVGKYRCEMKDLADDILHMTEQLKNKIGYTEGVLKGIATPFVIVDPAAKLTVTNGNLLKLLDHEGRPEEFYGQDVAHFFYGDASRKTVLGVAMAESRDISREVELVSRKGNKRNVRIDASPLFNSITGELMGALCVYADLTELRTGEARILEQNRKIAEAAQQADAISEQVASASHELSAQIEESSKGAEKQKDRTSEAATAMEQMNVSVVEVAKNASEAAHGADEARLRAQGGARVVHEAIESIFEVSQKARTMRESLGDLGRQAESIGHIMGVISDIADQTNLLALNAAIEAARAGDAGRGFAVVADEVRKLAEKTMTATKEVGQAISSIQGGTRESILAMDSAAQSVDKSTSLASKAGESLQEIVTLVEATADRVRNIATASEEQSAASEQISRSIEEVNQISADTAEFMEHSSKAVVELAELASGLKEMIRHIQQ